MSPKTSALKLSTHLLFSLAGAILLGIALLHAGKTLYKLQSPPTSLPNTPVNSVEQTINKALELVNTQTSSN